MVGVQGSSDPNRELLDALVVHLDDRTVLHGGDRIPPRPSADGLGPRKGLPPDCDSEVTL